MAEAGDQPVSPRSGLSKERTRVGVIGGGAWGTALACHCARMGHDTLIWALEKEAADAINTQHENTVFLKVRAAALRWAGRRAGRARGRHCTCKASRPLGTSLQRS